MRQGFAQQAALRCRLAWTASVCAALAAVLYARGAHWADWGGLLGICFASLLQRARAASPAQLALAKDLDALRSGACVQPLLAFLEFLGAGPSARKALPRCLAALSVQEAAQLTSSDWSVLHSLARGNDYALALACLAAMEEHCSVGSLKVAERLAGSGDPMVAPAAARCAEAVRRRVDALRRSSLLVRPAHSNGTELRPAGQNSGTDVDRLPRMAAPPDDHRIG